MPFQDDVPRGATRVWPRLRNTPHHKFDVFSMFILNILSSFYHHFPHRNCHLGVYRTPLFRYTHKIDCILLMNRRDGLLVRILCTCGYDTGVHCPRAPKQKVLDSRSKLETFMLHASIFQRHHQSGGAPWCCCFWQDAEKPWKGRLRESRRELTVISVIAQNAQAYCKNLQDRWLKDVESQTSNSQDARQWVWNPDAA